VFFKFALAAVLLCALVGCSRSPAHPERMAVFAFENLTGDSSLDWASRAAAEYTVDSMAGSKTLCAALALSNDDLWNARATRALRGYFSAANGRLYLAARTEDTARSRTVANFAVDGPASNGPLPLAGELVRRLDAAVTPSRARDAGAWKAYVDALAHTPAEAAPLLERALSIDPDFAPAIFILARLRATMGDRAAANKVVEDALSRRSRLSEIHAAKLDFIAASLRADPLTRFRALSRLATLVPADSDRARETAEAATAARDYPAAARWYERAALTEPSYGVLWNQLGYARAYLKDLKGAVDAIERYRRLSPASANPADSLGDVHFYLGRFAGAEQYYLDAYGKDPKFLAGGTLFKAAQARLMLRDMPAAGALFEKYAAARRLAGDPALEFTRAQWEYLSGKRREAIARLEPLAASLPRAAIQLVVWHLDMGDRAAARAAAGKAPQAATAPDGELLLMARFLAEPPASSSEWALRAERVFPAPAQTGVKKYALAYALLFSKEYGAAALVLKEIVAHSGPGSSDNAPALHGWALAETGHKREAAPWLEVFPIPMPNGFSLFACLSYPRQLTLRAGS
jgi:tetratricopeptide (TPR) repeat protein